MTFDAIERKGGSPGSAPPRLSLVVPAFNEATRLARGIPQLLDVIPRDETEVIVVDDGSTDGTAEIARRHLAEMPRHVLRRLPRNSGKGAAVRAGVVEARGEVIAYMDADMATDPADLIQLVGALRASPVAVGSREAQGSVVDDKSNLRTLMSRTFRLFVASAVRLPTRDTQCGFKAFHGSVAKLLFHGTRVDRFAFDVEVLTRAARLGLDMEEVPVRWTDVAGSKVSVVRDSLGMLVDVGRTRWRRACEAPIYGVALTDQDPLEGARLLRSCVRAVDTVVSWEGGALALFPCVPPTAAAQLVRRMDHRVASHRLQHVALNLETLERSEFRFDKAIA
ncbi:MAG TPA: dolichyl-phosphate beta-glucosyltransferase [Acidimicrobiales bacterium]|nr:dolichyl-phosphate beta-glucosyltransferase [Acidimicrobiales bacterium]